MDGKAVGIFVAGMGFAFVGTFIVIKAMRPTLKEKLSTIAAREIVRYGQSQNIPLATMGVNETFLKTRLLYPAVEAAFDEAYI